MIDDKNTSFRQMFFDMDGVILDSERALLVEWKIIAQERNLADIEMVYSSVCGTTHETTREMMLEAYGPDFPFEELDGFQTGFYFGQTLAVILGFIHVGGQGEVQIGEEAVDVCEDGHEIGQG